MDTETDLSPFETVSGTVWTVVVGSDPEEESTSAAESYGCDDTSWSWR